MTFQSAGIDVAIKECNQPVSLPGHRDEMPVDTQDSPTGRSDELFMMREDSNLMSLMREDSFPFAPFTPDGQFGRRENSMGRENSVENTFIRENSLALSLARESSVDFSQLMACANVHDFLLDHPDDEDDDIQGEDRRRDREGSQKGHSQTALTPSETMVTQTVVGVVEETQCQQNITNDDDLGTVVPKVEVDQEAEIASKVNKEDQSVVSIVVVNTSHLQAVPCQQHQHPPCWTARASKRGAHVKDRPDMQKRARDGLAHWSSQLKLVRTAWTARALAKYDFRCRFQGQIELSIGRIKSKQECLLRVLQLACDDGLITPAPFGPGGFFGWSRFDVVPERAAEFRRAMEAMFPAGFREDTLKETFRRSGLVPERWQWHLGWRGQVGWVFNTREQGRDRP